MHQPNQLLLRGMREVFARLASLGVGQTIMLTGDNEQVAKAVAASVGIRNVRAGLLPPEKVARLGLHARDHPGRSVSQAVGLDRNPPAGTSSNEGQEQRSGRHGCRRTRS